MSGAGIAVYAIVAVVLLGMIAGGINSRAYNRGAADQALADHSREQLEALAQQRLGLCGWLETVCKVPKYDKAAEGLLP